MNLENGNDNPDNLPTNFDRTLEHLKAGYANAQEIIRFVDTKTSFLTGATTLTMGFVLEAARQYAQLPVGVQKGFAVHPYLVCALMRLGELSLFAGGLCIWCCVMSLIARPPLKKLRGGSTLLFPFYEGKPSEKQYCAKASLGLTNKEILKEYDTQIWNVGVILRKKVTRHRWAGKVFLIQLITIAIGGIIFLRCIQD